MVSNKTTIFSFIWVLIDKFGYSLITLASTLILARLLSPYEFGLIGTVAIFISVSDMIVEAGFGAALVQKNKLSSLDYSTVFIFNIAISLILYVILFIFAPYIASYYDNPIYSTIIRLLSLKLLLNAFTLTQRVHLIRDLDFRKQSFINMTALIFSVIIAILMAYYDFGVWALVTQTVIYSFFVSVMMIFTVRFVPSLVFDKQSFKELFGFGGRIIINSIFKAIYNDIFGLIITKKFSTNLTGMYSQAKKLVSFPNSIFSALYDNAGFAVLSRINDENEFRKKLSNINQGVFTIALPLLLIIPFQSSNIIHIVLGKKWVEAGPILSILSVSLLTSLISIFSTNILKSKGKGKEILRYGILKIIIGFIILFITLQISFTAILYGIVITNLIYSMIVFHLTTKMCLYQWKDLINDFGKLLTFLIVVNFIAKYSINLLLDHSSIYLSLGIHITIIILFLFTYVLLFQRNVFNFLKNNFLKK